MSFDSQKEDLDLLLEQAAQFDWSDADQPQEPLGAMQNVLVFGLGGHFYALDAQEIQEVVGSRKVTPLPGAPASISGVFVYHREVVALLELDLWFGHRVGGEPKETTSSRVAVVRSKEALVGFDVGDEAQLVERVQQDEPELMEALDPAIAQVIKGVYAGAQGLVALLDVEKLCESVARQGERGGGREPAAV